MTVMELLKKGTVNEIVKYFSNKVNDLCFKPQKICLELKESQEMKNLTDVRHFFYIHRTFFSLKSYLCRIESFA